MFGHGLLQIMVAGGDEHVQGIGRLCVGPLQSAGIGRLHEGRPFPLFDDQAPRRIVRVVRCHRAQRIAPAPFVARQVVAAGSPKRERAKLHEEHVPGRTLVRSQRGEPWDFALGHRREQGGERRLVAAGKRKDRVGDEIHRSIRPRRGGMIDVRSPTSIR